MAGSDDRIDQEISPKRVLEVLAYDALAGNFLWKRSAGGVKGKIAGSIDRDGYRWIRIDGVLYQSANLVWLVETGRWPRTTLDHRDRIPANDRKLNLRLASKSKNGANRGLPRSNTSGAKGVVWHKGAQKWAARIGVNYKSVYLGLFSNKADAEKAYDVAAKKAFGKFALTNSEIRAAQ